MSFLPFPSDAEFTPEAAAAAERFLAEQGGALSDLDRTLLGDAFVFESYRRWFGLQALLVPYLGERAVELFSYALSDSYGAEYPASFFREQLIANGDDPDAPQVTETEQLLIDWGRAIGSGPAVDAALTGRVEAAFQPRLRLLLTAYAGFMIATGLFTVVGQVPARE